MSRRPDTQLEFLSSDPEVDGPLLTGEVIKLLKNVATLFRNGRTGNVRISRALSGLTRLLSTHKDIPFKETLAILEGVENKGRRRSTYSKRTSESIDVQRLTHDHIRKILKQNQTTKKLLITIGTEKFGIPTAGLKKQSKDVVIDTILAALDHADSIKIISEQAQRGGRARSS